jgi:alpha-beta hydrolase superfamily lysophospholipase
MGGLLALKAIERMPVSGLVLLSAELPRDLRPPARPHELRDIPEVYGRALIGWETLPERLLRDDRDLTLADVLRIQHLLGQKPHEAGAARRQMVSGVSVDRRNLAGIPLLVVGGGLDRTVTMETPSALPSGSARRTSRSRRTALRPAPGRDQLQQVAESVRSFPETNRL